MNSKKITKKDSLFLILMIASIWGLVEAGAGLALRGSCARLYSGSILTGTTFLFFASAYAISGRLLIILLMPIIAGLFRIYGASISGAPIISGAVANPVYAFLGEALAFMVVIYLMKEKLIKSFYGRVLVGIVGTVLAVNMFLPVKLFTGIPACVVPGTDFPLAIWGLPVAMPIAAITAPLGFRIGEWIRHRIQSEDSQLQPLFIKGSLVVSAMCLLIVTFIYVF